MGDEVYHGSRIKVLLSHNRVSYGVVTDKSSAGSYVEVRFRKAYRNGSLSHDEFTILSGMSSGMSLDSVIADDGFRVIEKFPWE